MNNYYIGVDAGNYTGFAVWNSVAKKFRELDTYNFWQTIQRLTEYGNLMNKGQAMVTVVIEDVTQNSPVFFAEKTYSNTEGEHKQKLGAVCMQAQRVGSVKEKTTLMIEFCEMWKIPIIKQRPTKGSLTKMKADKFKDMTGFEGRTSEHSRDAAMLCFMR